jgi:hypothetical protein
MAALRPDRRRPAGNFPGSAGVPTGNLIAGSAGLQAGHFLLAVMLLAVFFFFGCASHHRAGEDDQAPADDDNDSGLPDDDDNDDASPPADDDGSPSDDDDLATELFVVGNEGTILHYDRAMWSPMKSGTTAVLENIWGSSAADIYVLGVDGQAGTVLHYDGSTWSDISASFTGVDMTFAQLFAVWGTAASDVFITGGEQTGYSYGQLTGPGLILHYDGVSWSYFRQAGDPPDQTLFDFDGIWGSSATDVYAVSDWQAGEPWNPTGGAAIYHYDGLSWSLSRDAGASSLSDVWGSSSTSIFAVGGTAPSNNGPLVLYYSGTGWAGLGNAVQAPGSLGSIWGTSSSDVFCAGWTDAGGYVVHYDGSQWTQTPFAAIYPSNLYGTSPSDFYMVACKGTPNCTQGVIYHYDGSSWSPLDIGAQPPLNGIWGPAP